ncbi:Hsp70 family protein [uncultured Tateyamaria sp.]|uniref:Hsp70 family protein n=1 Tax=uncultured Tateyamaria sp. TaxID=455651 RepID=UPI002606957D|nr:Hsp70 family protein [uncultured Tateyamaria sp.]
MAVLGVDFGTSNSAVGVAVDGQAHLIPLESGETTLPTAVFFDFEARKAIYGRPANAALIAGDEGRYMRALKSLLGTSLMRESRVLLGERLDFITIVARFLAELKQRAESATGQTFTEALSGRPVLFHSADPARNTQALVDLTECYHVAGFETVRFMPEPEAAALANRAALQPGDVALVVDIGGGTSDFTLFRQGQGVGIDILASHGVRLGGTNFDRALSLAFVMPELGMGSQIKHAFGDQSHAAPNAIFTDLATWQKIPFLYAPDTRRAAAELAQYAREPDKLNRLVRVLEDELGHDVAFAVEAAKIGANGATASIPQIDLAAIERGMTVPLYPIAMTSTLAPMADQIRAAAATTLEMGGVEPDAVNRLIFVGGSSLMQVVEDALRTLLPRAEVHRGAAMTAIVEGLALAAS